MKHSTIRNELAQSLAREFKELGYDLETAKRKAKQRARRLVRKHLKSKSVLERLPKRIRKRLVRNPKYSAYFSNIECPNCGEVFDAEIYIVLGEDEPEYIGIEDEFSCPDCGNTFEATALAMLSKSF